jgi:hypothetical protein
MSFGKITVLKKDGVTEGSTVDIKKEITIGRLEENMHYFLKIILCCSAHPANIRIKSPNIAAEHARICVDENGKVNIFVLE